MGNIPCRSGLPIEEEALEKIGFRICCPLTGLEDTPYIKKQLMDCIKTLHYGQVEDPYQETATSDDFHGTLRETFYRLQNQVPGLPKTQISGTFHLIPATSSRPELFSQVTDPTARSWLHFITRIWPRNCDLFTRFWIIPTTPICQKTETNNFEKMATTQISLGTFSEPDVFYRACRWSEDKKSKARLDFSIPRKTMDIFVKGNQLERLEFALSCVHNTVSVSVKEAGGKLYLYFHLRNPPKLYEWIDDDTRSDDDFCSEGHSWARRAHLTFGTQHQIGTCDVLEVVLEDIGKTWKVLQMLKQNSWEVRFCLLSDKIISEKNFISHEHWIRQNAEELIPEESLRFQRQYAMLVATSHGYKMTSKLNRAFLENAFSPDLKDKTASAALYKLSDFLSREMDFCFLNLNKFWESVRSNEVACSDEKKTMRNVKITPTRIVFSEPEKPDSNRILRMYGPEHMMRALFRDEDGKQLNGIQCPRDDDRMFQDTIMKRLEDGLAVGGRVYKFLGGSNSQTRLHGCYLFAENGNHSTDTIRAKVGDLSRIRCPATYMARLGLAWTSSTPGVEINKRKIPDIYGGKDPDGKPYCFTDGIGTISKDAALRLLCASGEKMKGNKHLPSAYQIRCGGIKGVVAVDPELKGCVWTYRDSMHKYDSNHSELCLADNGVSEPKRLLLNQQIIPVLSKLGVPNNCFLKLQGSILKSLLTSFLDNAEACKQLEFTIPNCQALEQQGFSFLQDPFFKSLLVELVLKELGNLKDRHRLEIPPDAGRNMMGVVDETGQLEYGQVFVQYSRSTWKRQAGEGKVVLEGEVVVSKMPCLHPGDARKLVAVNIPSLAHMCDVIVFPQKGKRPHPNEMAGSDLDGDLYTVLWKKDFIFQENHEAMDFPSAQKKENSDPITEKDLISHFTEIIKNDKVGMISRKHLIEADFREDGVCSPECLELAKIHALTVDAPKTGYQCEIPEFCRNTPVPDFLNKSDHKVERQSRTILGRLYRESNGIMEHLKSLTVPINRPVVPQVQEMLIPKEIQRMYTEYKKEIGTLQEKYKVKSEAGLFAGRVQDKFGDKEKAYNTKKDLREDIKRLRKKMLSKFWTLKMEEEEKAKLCYLVAYTDKDDDTCLSFPWQFCKSVAKRLKQRVSENQNGKRDTPTREVFLSLGSKLLDCLTNHSREATKKCKLLDILETDLVMQETDPNMNQYMRQFSCLMATKHKWVCFAASYIFERAKDHGLPSEGLLSIVFHVSTTLGFVSLEDDLPESYAATRWHKFVSLFSSKDQQYSQWLGQIRKQLDGEASSVLDSESICTLARVVVEIFFSLAITTAATTEKAWLNDENDVSTLQDFARKELVRLLLLHFESRDLYYNSADFDFLESSETVQLTREAYQQLDFLKQSGKVPSEGVELHTKRGKFEVFLGPMSSACRSKLKRLCQELNHGKKLLKEKAQSPHRLCDSE